MYGPFLWWRNVPFPFFQEDTVWPAAHFIAPFAFFFALQDYLFALLFLYIFESVEHSLPSFFFEPRWDDGWLGDPMMGALGVTTGAVYYATFNWGAVPFQPPIWLRLLVFALVHGGSTLVIGLTALKEPARHYHLLWYATLHAASIFALYAPYWAADPSDVCYREALVHTLVLALTPYALALVALPVSLACSSFRRAFLMALVLVSLALTIFIVVVNGSYVTCV